MLMAKEGSIGPAMNRILELLLSLIPLLATAAAVLTLLFFAYWFLLGRRTDLANEHRLYRQIAMFGLTAAGAIAISLALPVSDSTRNQVIALIGVLLSGVIAFSSATIVSNLMAGLVLHVTRPFRTGDFIRVGEYFGRVVGRGLFSTEVQTEHRELVYLSNAHMLSTPVTVVRSSGTIITATLSLGYDVHHTQVKGLLLEAARNVDLEEPFVKIVELGNYAITYSVSGLLTEVKGMLASRSRLFESILDALHTAGVEIVSPSFMNQRRQENDTKILPVMSEDVLQPDSPSSEDMVFDKAEEAEQQEKAEINLKEEISKLQAQAKESEGEAKKQIEVQIEQLREQLVEIVQDEVDTGGDEDDVARQDVPPDKPPAGL